MTPTAAQEFPPRATRQAIRIDATFGRPIGQCILQFQELRVLPMSWPAGAQTWRGAQTHDFGLIARDEAGVIPLPGRTAGR